MKHKRVLESLNNLQAFLLGSPDHVFSHLEPQHNEQSPESFMFLSASTSSPQRGRGWVEKSSNLVKTQHTHNCFCLQREKTRPHSMALTSSYLPLDGTYFKTFIAQQKDRPSTPSETSLPPFHCVQSTVTVLNLLECAGYSGKPQHSLDPMPWSLTRAGVY